MDPTNLVPESDDADNSYPANATPLNLNVQTAAALNLRFVPVTPHGRRHDRRRDRAPTQPSIADQTVRMHPLAVVNVDVRAPYTYSDTAQIQSNDGNGVWLKILSQINALQAAEGGTKNYFGIIAVPYGGGHRRVRLRARAFGGGLGQAAERLRRDGARAGAQLRPAARAMWRGRRAPTRTIPTPVASRASGVTTWWPASSSRPRH